MRALLIFRIYSQIQQCSDDSRLSSALLERFVIVFSLGDELVKTHTFVGYDRLEFLS